ncbi:small multi-drug export protein [Aureococcus anophagefferens]|nr:small multi-drug export protein [Aureococcus anophagefferens]
MGLPIAKVFVLCVIGNMAPILPLLLALRSPLVQKILDKPLSKARSKSDAVSGNARWSALAAFVGVPFPGTGAWTGAMVAFVLGMPLSEALSAIFAGVLVAGAIMSALVAAGTKARAVAAVIAGAFAFKALAGGDDAPEETAPAASD